MNKITNPYGPNVTILLPGTCNANCEFCFWDKKEGAIFPPEGYFEKVFTALKNLPEQFKTLSISGGEPTLSPYLGKFLSLLGKHRRERHYDRVVLTTNGTYLENFIGAIGCVVDHVNISRHAIGTRNNYEKFGTVDVPSDALIESLAGAFNAYTDTDVTINCVIDNMTTVAFCRAFIKYAKDTLRADAVCFRKVSGDIIPAKAENYFAKTFGVKNESKCPVCRGMEQEVGGFTVRWKSSVDEPSLTTKGIYEIVMHPDGKAYADWGRKQLVTVLPPKASAPAISFERHLYGGGCGSKSASPGRGFC